MSALTADPCHVVRPTAVAQAHRPLRPDDTPPPTIRPALCPVRMERHARRRDGATNRHLLLLAAVLRVAVDIARNTPVPVPQAPCPCCPDDGYDYEGSGDMAGWVADDLAGAAWVAGQAADAIDSHALGRGRRFRPDGDSHAADLRALVALCGDLFGP